MVWTPSFLMGMFFSKRIKADGVHVGRVLDDSGNTDYDFFFACQQDADRCCAKNSSEYFEIIGRHRGDGNCGEINHPITKVERISRETIDGYIDNSNARKYHFFPKLFALIQSRAGSIDFQYMYNFDASVLYLTDIADITVAHNHSNFGNFLWGAAMNSLGIQYPDVFMGAHLYTLLFHGEFDSSDDVFSFTLGYFWNQQNKKKP